MEHPLIPIMRWWVIQFAAIAITFWLPEAGLALFAGNCFGWWPGDGCCGSGSGISPTSCGCTTLSSSLSFTIANMVNGSCGSCTSYNSTTVVTCANASTCTCNGGFTDPCVGGSFTETVFISKSGGNTIISSGFSNTLGGGFTSSNHTLGASDTDCTNINETWTEPGSFFNCDASGLSVTVVSV